MNLLIPLSFLAFVALGLPDGLLGIAWPSIRSDFGLPLDAFGILIAVTMAGYVGSSFSTGKLLSVMGMAPLLASSTFLASLSLAGYALVPGFGTLLAAGFLAGAGGGAVDSALNTYAAFRFRARTLHWLHASYSLGALMGPLVLSAILAGGLTWRWGYGLVAAAQSVLGIVFILTRKAWDARPAATSHTEPSRESAARNGEALASASGSASTTASYRETLSRGAVWLGVVAFLFYTGLEFSVGQWTFTLLTEGRGMEAEKAALWVGVFFGGFFGGRVLAGLLPLGGRIRPLFLLCGGCMVAGAVSMAFGGTGPAALAGLGLSGMALAPVFPMLVSATPARLGKRHAANAMGFQVAAATVGQALIPGLIGVAAQLLGLEAIAKAHILCGLLVLVCLVTVASGRGAFPPESDQRPL